MKKTLIIALSLLTGISCSSVVASDTASDAAPRRGAAESNLPKIGRADLQNKLGKVILVNALSEESFKTSRIKGSVNIPYENVAKTATNLLPQKDADIVVYCMNVKCHASDRVADELAKMGYKNVSIYREGLQDWLRAGLPAEGSNPQAPIEAQKTAQTAK